jgi:hypothetical protein
VVFDYLKDRLLLQQENRAFISRSKRCTAQIRV